MEYMGGKPLCMNQYYQILSSCRIPGPKRDSIVNYAKGKRQSRHIAVVHNFQVGQLPLGALCGCAPEQSLSEQLCLARGLCPLPLSPRP